MLIIDSSNFIARLEAFKLNLPKRVENVLVEIANKMQADIASTAALAWSPSWQNAINEFTGKPYFTQDKPGVGLLDAIRLGEVIPPSEAEGFSKNGLIKIGVGDIATLDEFAGDYWRIFLGYGEYDRGGGIRAGGSLKHGFTPIPGGGRHREGVNLPGKDGLADGKKPKTTKLHPGVFAVSMFDETLQYYKPIITARLTKAIKMAAKE